MIRKVLILPFFLFFLSTAIGQNLVPNGGFEEVITCPQFLGALDSDCANWFQSIQVPGVPMNENPSPDWYHDCATDESLTPPYTEFSYQEPYEGGAYAGIVCYSINGDPVYREIIGVQLIVPLVAGATYRVYFQVVRVSSFINKIASNGLGVKFSNTEIYESNDEVIDNAPTLFVDSIITDTVNWNEVSFEFVADEAYNFMHLGNFFDDQHTDTVHIDPPNALLTYYFIDAVGVEQVLGLAKAPNEKFLVLYPNPCASSLKITTFSNVKTIKIFSESGQKLLEHDNIFRKDYQINTAKLAKGLYVIEVVTESVTIRKRFTKL